MTFAEAFTEVRRLCGAGQRPAIQVDASVSRRGDVEVRWSCAIHWDGDCWVSDDHGTPKAMVAEVRAYRNPPPSPLSNDNPASVVIGDIS